jgi:predicted dehydrogenase
MVSFLLAFTAGASFRPKGGFAAGMVADLYGTDGHIQGGYFLRDSDMRRWCYEARSGEADKSHYFDGKSRAGDIDVAIIRALRGEAPPPLTALDARNAVAVVEAAYQSIATARVAEVDWRDE